MTEKKQTDKAELQTETKLVTLGRRKEWTHGVVNPPVYRASTCLFESYEALREGINNPWGQNLFYGRKGTPTHWSLEEAINELHAGERTHLLPSGVAALSSAMLAVSKAGGHMLVSDSAYEPTRGIANGLLKQCGMDITYFDPLIGADIATLMQPNTTAILAESPGSLTFEMSDIPAFRTVADEHPNKPIIIADNTWATPLFCKPLELGADIAIEAVTKYIGGHSDLLMGSATANLRAQKILTRTVSQLGQTVSSEDAALALRGLRTLGVRLKEHERRAIEIARWLQGHDKIARVLHPALPDDPGHAIWQRDMSGSTGLFSVILKEGEYSDTARIVDHMRLFKMGFSWGGFESLILPTDPSTNRTAVKWKADGPLLRIHIGLEDMEDLKQDLVDALARY